MPNARSISAINVPITSNVSGFIKGIDKAEERSKDFEKKNKQRAVTARGLLADMAGGDVSKALSAFGRLGGSGGKEMVSLAAKVTLVSIGLSGLAHAAIAVGKSLVTGGFNRIGELGKDAVEIGATSEELSRLRNVAVATGTDFKDLSAFSSTLTDKINDTIGRADLGAASFGKLGTSAEELAKMPVGEQLKTLNRGFAALPNDAERARVAMALAGQAGLKNFRLLTLGVKDFDKAYNNGLVTTEDDVSEVRKLQIAIDKVVDGVEKLANTFTVYLLPPITRVADTLEAIASRFGVAVQASKAVAIPSATPKPVDPAKAAADQARAAAAAKAQADLAEKKELAAKAQARVVELQSRADKQAHDLAVKPGKLVQVPTTNGMGVRVKATNQKARDQHAATQMQLATAKVEAERARRDSLSEEESKAEAARLKRVDDEVAALKDQYSESKRTSGMDDVHRRVAAIKGATPAQQKDLIAKGYQAREADRTSALRDELQESTKLPQQKLSEDLNRIGRLVQLGAANGGLSRVQGIRAAAQKTAESGIGGPSQLTGALDARTAEGRSYLLSQMNRVEDPTVLARQGLALTGQTNNILSQILNKTGSGGTLMYR